MHELAAMKPLTKPLSRIASKQVLESLKAPSVRQVDVLRRAFTFRANRIGISRSDIARMTGISRQRIGQVLDDIQPEYSSLAFPKDIGLLTCDYRRVQEIVRILEPVDVKEIWADSEEFQTAMLRLVGYQL